MESVRAHTTATRCAILTFGHGTEHTRRDSSEADMPPTRPLAEKVQRLLELMFGRLDRTGDGQLTAADFKTWL